MRQLTVSQIEQISGGYELTEADLDAIDFDPAQGFIFVDPNPTRESPESFGSGGLVGQICRGRCGRIE